MSIALPDLHTLRSLLAGGSLVGLGRQSYLWAVGGAQGLHRSDANVSTHSAANLWPIDDNLRINPPAGPSLSGKMSTTEVKRTKASTSGVADHEVGKPRRLSGPLVARLPTSAVVSFPLASTPLPFKSRAGLHGADGARPLTNLNPRCP